ncbi:MAG: ABC transporter permease [Chloroflexota bacterium]|nr:ABC transporter permease [Chloroflexota bacterium]
MRKTLLVGLREFRQHVTSRGFLLGAFATPLILLAIWVFGGGFSVGAQEEPFQQLVEAEQQDAPVGYVDRAGLIQIIPEPVPSDAFRPYGDVDAAQAALDRGDISAYYIVREDYRESGAVERVSPRFATAPGDLESFRWVLVRNIFPEVGAEQMSRLRWPFGGGGPTFVPVDAGEEGGGGGVGDTMLPFVVTIAVMLPLFSGGGYLFQSLTKEKGSRVMEVLLVSLRPRQLLAGKLLGLGALILVQYAIWLAIAGAALAVTGQQAAQLLAGVNLSAGEVLLILPYALGGFGLYAAVMAGVGALAPDVESTRGWVFVLTLPMMIPIYLWMAIVNAPHGPLAVILSLFPYSAPVGMLMRLTAATVPAWQVGVSLGLLGLAMVGTIWLTARLFRAQTLLSGESLSLGRFWAALTAG